MSLKPRTKETLKLTFAQLISNDACIMGARERPWYFAIIFALLAVVLAWTPIAVTYFTQDGSMVLSSTNYGLDTALIAFQEEAYDNDLSFRVAVDGEEHYIVTNFREKYGTVGDPYFDVNATQGDGSEELVFRCYYYGDITAAEVVSRKTDVLNSGTTENPYTVTTMFIADTCFYIDVHPNFSGTTSRRTVYGDYQNLDAGVDFGTFATLTMSGEARTTPISQRTTNWDGYYDETMTIWQGFFSKTYAATALNTAAIQSGISAGVFAGMVLLMGLMVYLMTRGKNNPFKIYTFWESQKIAYWMSFTPGLLSLALGFLMPSYAILIFVALLGVRTVWLTLKNLRPA